MPRPDTGVQNPVHKGGSIRMIDYRGRTIGTSLKSAGGDVSRGDMETLANLIGDASNATYNSVEIHNRIEWNDPDLNFFDEAEASVSEVIVIVLLHDTDSAQNQEVLIPAYDASLLIPGTNIVNVADTRIVAISDAALGIVNDDDNALNPDNYHGFRAFTTTRKASSGHRGTSARNLPAPVEATDTDEPGEAPGNLP